MNEQKDHGNVVKGVAAEMPLLSYRIANILKEQFKRIIIALDVDHAYYRLSEKEGLPDYVVEAAKSLYQAVYSAQLQELEGIKKQWASEHPDFYRQQTCLPSVDPDFVQRVLDRSSLEALGDRMTLERAVQGYKGCNAVLKMIPNEALDRYCTEVRPMLNNEHRTEWNEMVQDAHKRLQLPTFDQWLPVVPMELLDGTEVKMVCTSGRLSLDRQPVEDWSVYRSLMDEIITSSSSSCIITAEQRRGFSVCRHWTASDTEAEEQ